MITDPVLITGCPRSGTSITAGIVNLSGSWGGVMRGPGPYNKMGMFENGTIINDLIKPYLKSINCDPMAQHILPFMNTKMIIKLMCDGKDLRTQVIQILIKQKYDTGSWFFKDPKICLLWPLWHSAFPNTKWIIVRRNDKEIINSCFKTGFMRAYKHAEQWQMWINKHKYNFVQMKDAGLNIREVWPRNIIKGDFAEIKEVIAWLGFEWNEEKVKKFICPDLWKGGNDG